MAKIKLSRKVKFRYACKPACGTCKIAKDILQLQLVLSGRTRTPPDVLDVEKWLNEYLKQPLIVEELAIAAHEKWKLRTEVTGTTDTHGELTATCP